MQKYYCKTVLKIERTLSTNKKRINDTCTHMDRYHRITMNKESQIPKVNTIGSLLQEVQNVSKLMKGGKRAAKWLVWEWNRSIRRNNEEFW